ncbi:MAG TPA: LAGLIDADG family homing endonuclease [Candidatus Sulfotelmatobacter sp.]|nr:LAGLIDADG family homing endonuclease [Candidatus Sulfotelmatobacter sp.]
MATETDYAWAAGFFDGEGCVSIYSQKRYTCARVHIVQKDIRPLIRMSKMFGERERIGSVKRADRRHTYYRLTFSGQRAADVLEKMLPYLSLKREVAMLALQLQESVNKFSVKERTNVLPDSEMAYRRSLSEKAKWLNSGRWAAATTKPSGPETGCDSLNCTDGKGAEAAEMTARLN